MARWLPISMVSIIILTMLHQVYGRDVVPVSTYTDNGDRGDLEAGLPSSKENVAGTYTTNSTPLSSQI